MIDKCRRTFIVFGSQKGFDSAPVLISSFRWYVNIFKRVISLMSCHKSKPPGIEQTTNDFIVFCNLHKSEWANKPRLRIVKVLHDSQPSSSYASALSNFLSLSFPALSARKCRQNMCLAVNENRNVVFFVLSLASVFKAWRGSNRSEKLQKKRQRINNLSAKIEPERSLIDRDPQKIGEQRAVINAWWIICGSFGLSILHNWIKKD